LTRVRCALARRQARVRRLMKEEPDIKAVTQEASLLVSKAVELFVEALTAQALACSPADSIVRVGLAYTDVGAR
jgi:histone H3/H4